MRKTQYDLSVCVCIYLQYISELCVSWYFQNALPYSKPGAKNPPRVADTLESNDTIYKCIKHILCHFHKLSN